ncbi:deoxyribonuclease IV [Candidatus Babeliales bacterium]|nr:deoxyribonuclease IV [Candidatus Babeliales bacterium]
MKTRELGIHLRLENSYLHMLEVAHAYGLRSCQFFFTPQSTGKYLQLTPEDKKVFLDFRRKHFSTLFAHGSYWITPATGNEVSAQASLGILKKELALARQLEINYLVLHAGSAKNFSDKNDGIKAMATMLNEVLEDENNVKVLIENTAHAGKAVCSDLKDFVTLRKLLREPEKTSFCIDTTHAFAYGYDLEATDDFVAILNKTMGIENIKLIHLNDSASERGSRIDAHLPPGKGLIGKQILKRFVRHPKLKNVPIIIEPPVLDEREMIDMIEEVKTWL